MIKLLAALFVVAVALTSAVQSAELRGRWVTTTALKIVVKAHDTCICHERASALRDCLDRVVNAAAHTAATASSAPRPIGTSVLDLGTMIHEKPSATPIPTKASTDVTTETPKFPLPALPEHSEPGFALVEVSTTSIDNSSFYVRWFRVRAALKSH
ncbi:hypothetical protein FVF58_45085 [Paraburkholderia panacisoli]|uniref:Uncharacterized protein n=1 Tax=Paraburkholderia panacisoli TaxID=2603818 RepID=A0A5B0G4C4_9BURK|nr:hypothetical protein [Paraburkholderia panacisoli]KAA0998353.1 hypothetical protein FVF58_45085 [Paraburkholderia panacisoli]